MITDKEIKKASEGGEGLKLAAWNRLIHRIRVTERALDHARLSTPNTPRHAEWYLHFAEREIDAEIAQEGR